MVLSPVEFSSIVPEFSMSYGLASVSELPSLTDMVPAMLMRRHCRIMRRPVRGLDLIAAAANRVHLAAGVDRHKALQNGRVVEVDMRSEQASI